MYFLVIICLDFAFYCNFYNHHIRSIFKSHSISVTFKFCVVLGAQGIGATGFKRAQGNAHCAKFEINANRMTFEYAPNMMIVKVHPQSLLENLILLNKILQIIVMTIIQILMLETLEQILNQHGKE